jgi:phosphate transport system permease protein
MSAPNSNGSDGSNGPAPTSRSEGKGSGVWSFRRRQRSKSSLFAAGEPLVWLTGGALALGVFMVAGLLLLVLAKGMGTFWPSPLVEVVAHDGRSWLGEVTREERYAPSAEDVAALPDAARQAAELELAKSGGSLRRQLFRTGNYKLTQNHFYWVDDRDVARRSEPEWALMLERREWGVAIGFPEAFVVATPLETRRADGQAKSAAELADEARAVAARLGTADGAEIAWIERSGAEESLAPAAAAEEVASLVGVAQVYRGPEAAWRQLQAHLVEVGERFEQRRDLEKHEVGAVNAKQEAARLDMRQAELDFEQARGDAAARARAEQRLASARAELEQVRVWAEGEFQRIRAEIDAINRENARFRLLLRTPPTGTIPSQLTFEPVAQIVRAYPANRLDLGDKLGVYASRWWEFVSDEPREANSEGGVFPAIFGTVVMTLIMSLIVVPFGVLAALYLREYAKAGPLVSTVRIAVNNLAGVPSIVFGVFGLGFFCYVLGASIDDLLFAASLPNPTFGKGGLMWASLTLALLTLPVVIVATEEAVAAVPSSMREGSYACGASKWQTIQRIVLPRAMPGIITGMILAIARGAGEVAPLMLVGAVKLAPELPIDGLWPFVHPERSFMHLGFHIYDVGFQSQNSEAAKPMVFTTTLLLIALVAVLNFAAIWLRGRLRRKFTASHF